VFYVKGWIAIFLLALCSVEAAAISYLWRHRTIQISMPANGMRSIQLPDTVIVPGSDEYVTHTFPEGREVCSFDDTICWIKI
jgi:hypothetical protein